MSITLDNDNINCPAIVTWVEHGLAVTAEYGSILPGRAGLLANRQGAYSASFSNIAVNGSRITGGNSISSPVYKFNTYNGKPCLWDANGNLTHFGDDEFTYDAWNRMTSANGVKYIYDHKGRRVGKIDGATVYTYIYHGWSVIAEYKNGQLQKEYVDGINTDEHLAMYNHQTGQTYYYVLDWQNGTDRIVDVNGQVVEKYQYTAYGETTIFSNSGYELEYFPNRQ